MPWNMTLTVLFADFHIDIHELRLKYNINVVHIRRANDLDFDLGAQLKRELRTVNDRDCNTCDQRTRGHRFRCSPDTDCHFDT
jgi:hypothetical protein